MTNTSTYSVCLWGSNPTLGNDDCWTGADFDTLEAARQAYLGNARQLFPGITLTEGEWLEIDGPDFHAERQLSKDEWQYSKRQARLNDAASQSERVWEHRMLHGITDDE